MKFPLSWLKTHLETEAALEATITALTGISPGQGEMVVLTPSGNGNFRVAGRLRPAADVRK